MIWICDDADRPTFIYGDHEDFNSSIVTHPSFGLFGGMWLSTVGLHSFVCSLGLCKTLYGPTIRMIGPKAVHECMVWTWLTAQSIVDKSWWVQAYGTVGPNRWLLCLCQAHLWILEATVGCVGPFFLMHNPTEALLWAPPQYVRGPCGPADQPEQVLGLVDQPIGPGAQAIVPVMSCACSLLQVTSFC